jgi:hypothetical protein
MSRHDGLERRKFLICRGTSLSAWRLPLVRIQVAKYIKRKVVTVALVTTDAFIVVQEITAAIENEAVSIDFDRSRMMRRMPVNDRHACLVDEGPGQNLLLIRNVISPIGSPMDRNDDEIARSPERHDLVSGLQRACLARSGSKLTPGASGVAAHSNGMPLDVDPNEKIRSRALARFSTAGARAS